MDKSGLKRQRHCTIVAIVVIGCAFLAVNIYPRVRWGSENYYMPNDVYEHGWPISYMSRELVADPDMGSVYYPPWPFGRQWPLTHGSFGNPPLLRFTTSWLVFDVLVSFVVVTLASSFVHTTCTPIQILPQFKLIHLLAFTAIACLCFAIIRWFGPDIVAYPLFLLLHFLPNSLVMLSLILAGVQIVKTIGSVRTMLWQGSLM